MPKVGEIYRGVWPPNPVKRPLLVGQPVLYLTNDGKIARSEIDFIGTKVVELRDLNWIYISELSEDNE